MSGRRMSQTVLVAFAATAMSAVAMAQAGAPPLEQKVPGPATASPPKQSPPATDTQAGNTQPDAAPSPTATPAATPTPTPTPTSTRATAAEAPGDPVATTSATPKR